MGIDQTSHKFLNFKFYFDVCFFFLQQNKCRRYLRMCRVSQSQLFLCKQKQIIRKHFHWITLHFNYDNYAGSTIYHELSKSFAQKAKKNIVKK